MREYYLMIARKRIGPFDSEDLRKLLVNQTIDAGTLCSGDKTHWQPLFRFVEEEEMADLETSMALSD